MPLVTEAQVCLQPGSSQFTGKFLASLIPQVDRMVKEYCHQELEQADYVEYHSGNDKPELLLRQMPVQSVAYVRQDPAGAWGQGSNPFPSTSSLVQGSQWALKIDRDGLYSYSGIVLRLGGGFGSTAGFWPELGYQGKLAARMLPSWPRGYGNIKVSYRGGYAPQGTPNAPNLPADLSNAAARLLLWIAINGRYGQGLYLGNESGPDYSYGLSQLQHGTANEIGSIRDILSHYRRPVW